MTREEAIAYFKDMNECTYGDVEPIQMAIKALEQEPRKGHWIMLGTKEEIYCEEAKCSICGSVEVNAGYDKYCPTCGARMEGD